MAELDVELATLASLLTGRDVACEETAPAPAPVLVLAERDVACEEAVLEERDVACEAAALAPVLVLAALAAVPLRCGSTVVVELWKSVLVRLLTETDVTATVRVSSGVRAVTVMRGTPMHEQADEKAARSDEQGLAA